LFRRAQALTKAGRLQESQAALQDFLEKHPTSPFKNSAAWSLPPSSPSSARPARRRRSWTPRSSARRRRTRPAAALAESYPAAASRERRCAGRRRALESAPLRSTTPDSRTRRTLDAAPGRDIASWSPISTGSRPPGLRRPQAGPHPAPPRRSPHAREFASDIVSADGQGPYADSARGVLKAAQEPGSLNPRLLGVVLRDRRPERVRGPGRSMESR